MSAAAGFERLEFRDPLRARALVSALERAVERAGRPIAIMHVCGSHEQAVARFGLRSVLPDALDLIAGPGCPVCVTDAREIDECVALADRGVRIATYGDMLRVPGSSRSLADAKAAGASVEVVYAIDQAIELARRDAGELVFFATGFETTAVATAAALLSGVPPNFSVLAAHKYIPPVMEIVAEMPERRVEGFLAAGHAATITGSGIFEPFVARHRMPVVVAGFEPLDILAALVKLVTLVAEGRPEVANMFPRCVTREGNVRAQELLFRALRPVGGHYRGIAHVPNGNLRLRDELARFDARRRFDVDATRLPRDPRPARADRCRCGDIMAGTARPTDCQLFGTACSIGSPVGACMVSTEGTCRIWMTYGVGGGP